MSIVDAFAAERNADGRRLCRQNQSLRYRFRRRDRRRDRTIGSVSNRWRRRRHATHDGGAERCALGAHRTAPAPRAGGALSFPGGGSQTTACVLGINADLESCADVRERLATRKRNEMLPSHVPPSSLDAASVVAFVRSAKASFERVVRNHRSKGGRNMRGAPKRILATTALRLS
jgi:hypothetical protein